MSQTLLEVKNLSKIYTMRAGSFSTQEEVHALKGVSFEVTKGASLGVVGESGSGKSTLARCVAGLIKPTKGEIHFDGNRIDLLSKKEFRPFRKKLQLIFQDPHAALNPRMTVFETLEEPLILYQALSEKERIDRVKYLLSLVGLSDKVLERFPHEFSGGQRQRVCIARALAVEPEFIICDEPVSSLDVSIQAQILNLLIELQEKLALTYFFISHDLRVIEYMCHDVVVLSQGEIVERGGTSSVLASPQHVYTQELLGSILKIPT